MEEEYIAQCKADWNKLILSIEPLQNFKTISKKAKDVLKELLNNSNQIFVGNKEDMANAQSSLWRPVMEYVCSFGLFFDIADQKDYFLGNFKNFHEARCGKGTDAELDAFLSSLEDLYDSNENGRPILVTQLSYSFGKVQKKLNNLYIQNSHEVYNKLGYQMHMIQTFISEVSRWNHAVKEILSFDSKINKIFLNQYASNINKDDIEKLKELYHREITSKGYVPSEILLQLEPILDEIKS